MDALPGEVRTVALAGDWHGDTNYARRAIQYAHEGGAQGVVHLGDFGIWPGAQGSRFLKAINNQLDKRGMWLALVDGNHEDHDQLDQLEILPSGVRSLGSNAVHLPRGFRWTWHDKKWLALGGAVSLDKKHRIPGLSWWPGEQLSAEQAEQAIAQGPADVIVSHDMASGVEIPGLSRHWDIHALLESDGHRAKLRTVADAVRPSHWWHGHMHVHYAARVEFGGRACDVHGLDCNGSPIGDNVVVVDTESLAETS